MHNQETALQTSLLKRNPKLLSHCFHQRIHDIRERHLQGVAVAVDACRDHVTLEGHSRESIRQIFEPLADEQLQLRLRVGRNRGLENAG